MLSRLKYTEKKEQKIKINKEEKMNNFVNLNSLNGYNQLYAPPFVEQSYKNARRFVESPHQAKRRVTFESDKYEHAFEFKNSLNTSDLLLEAQYQGYLNAVNYQTQKQHRQSGPSKQKNLEMQTKKSQKGQNSRHTTKHTSTKAKPALYKNTNEIYDYEDEELLVILTGVNMLPVNNNNPKLLKKSLEKLFDYIDNYIKN